MLEEPNTQNTTRSVRKNKCQKSGPNIRRETHENPKGAELYKIRYLLATEAFLSIHFIIPFILLALWNYCQKDKR